MRICHVTDGYLPRLGGIETQVHELALAQLAGGDDVEIVTGTSGAGDDASGGVRVHRPPPALTGIAEWAARRALGGDVDVLHVHLSILSPVALTTIWRAAAAGVPVVATMHSMWGRAEVALPAARTVLAARAGSTVWTAVSSAAAEPLCRGLGVPVAVVPNGVELGWWAANPAGNPVSGALRVLTVMRLARRKRPVPFVRTIAATQDRLGAGSDVRRVAATIVGDGGQRGRVARVVHRTPGVDVTLTGRLAKAGIRQLCGRHDVYVAPAPLESFGIAALEARAAGLPVIGFRNSGLRDFVNDGVDGILVDEDSDIVTALTRLAGSPDELSRLSRAARDVLPALGWPVTTAGYREAYEQALARRPASRQTAVSS